MKWPICDLCGAEHDGGGCDGCDRSVCPDCMGSYAADVMHVIAVCKICAVDPAKERELTEHLTPAFIAHLQRLRSGQERTWSEGGC